MPSFSKRLQEHALDLTWSLWAELGVSGWTRLHTSHAIDPEPLILFTASLGDSDPRLRDEATDWCLVYGRYVSAARLRNLLAHEATEVRDTFGEFAATVNADSTLRWPGATTPRRFQRSGRSQVPDFRRPSLIALRMRALFGVGARAEILRVFLADASGSLSATELAPEAGYTKRNVADTLDALRMAGLLEVLPVRNQLRFRLVKAAELRAMVGEIPATFPRWHQIFHILGRLLETARKGESLAPDVQAVEAARALHDLQPDLRLAEVAIPSLDFLDVHLWPAFEGWALEVAQAWATAGSATPTSGRRRVAT
jgi:DNA-binding transcriptional ArsR family regulator